MSKSEERSSKNKVRFASRWVWYLHSVPLFAFSSLLDHFFIIHELLLRVFYFFPNEIIGLFGDGWLFDGLFFVPPI